MSTPFKHLALACMMGLGLAGCESNDSDTGPETSENILEKQLSFYIQSANGMPLEGAVISIAGETVKTNESGRAQIKIIVAKSAKTVVLKLSREGYINQSIALDINDLSNISANMLQIKQTVRIAEIQSAQVIQSAYQNAQITIPANAFVKANGTPATGPVTVEFTPWDIRNDDLSAMPANGVALNANGQVVNLISAGMITATFKDADGNRLQLAKDKKADIQMDLPLQSINNQNLSVGSEIPMWHFNESKGLWVEEGKGQVIASTASATGLAVHATVAHFSTWNWDFEFTPTAGQVNVKCRSAATAVPCYVTATVTLADGSSFTKTSSLTEAGANIVNMPSNGSIRWTAKDLTGTMIGEKTSGVNGSVVIDLGQPSTNNFVKCVSTFQEALECSGTVNGLPFSVPKEGGRILTGLKNVNGLTWNAKGQHYTQGSAVYQAQGSKNSNNTENVTIVLNDTVKLFDQMLFKLRCDSAENASSCAVKLNGEYSQLAGDADNQWHSFVKEFNIPLNQYINVYLPIPPQNMTNSVYLNGHASILLNGLKRQTRYGLENVYQTNELRFNLDEGQICDPNIGPEDGVWDELNDKWIYPKGYPSCHQVEMPT